MSRRVRLVSSILAVAVVAVWYAWGLPWTSDMVEQPSVSPGAGPRAPVEGTLPRGGEWPRQRSETEEKTPAAPVVADGNSGERLYGDYCQPCHGVAGAGDGPVAAVFIQPGSLRAAEVQEHNDGWLYGTIRNGYGSMPRYGPELSPEQRWQIVHFIRTLNDTGR